VLLLLLGTLSGVTGVFMGWLAWFGAVEPLPPEAAQKATETIQQATEVPCGICGQGVPLADLEIRYDCGFGCGRVFHSGCYRARASVARDDSCAVCGYQPQAGG